MPISKTPRNRPFPLRYKEILSPAVERYSELPTVCTIKQNKLFGIPLTSALTGQTLSDDAIEFYIKAAISEIEHSLDLYITPVTFLEKHDYIPHNFNWNYNYTKVDHPNVLDVEKVEVSFNNSPTQPGFIDFPLEFVHVMPQEGVIQLVPAFGTAMSGFMMSAFSGAQFYALRALAVNNFPGAVRITYTAGFEFDKIPASIAQLIEIIAAINVLSALGPILFPMNSISIGIDGTSQSTGTMGPKFLNDRIDQLTKERERQYDIVKGYYQRRWLVDYF